MGKDFRSIGEFEDLHEYVQEFKSLPMGFLSDLEKIYELTVRLTA